MKGSNLSFSALNVPHLAEIIKQIQAECVTLQIDFFIIGAIARNAWFLENGESARGTRDADFAVAVPSFEAYETLKARLTTQWGFTQSQENFFCLLSPKGNQVDLLPFTALQENDQISFQGNGLNSISVQGFPETYGLALEEVKIEEIELKICSIEAILMLKLLAFDDRPEVREKDAVDINSICLHYPVLNLDQIWVEDNFDLAERNEEMPLIGMIALGGSIGKIVGKNPVLRTRVLRILDDAINLNSRLAYSMIRDPENENLNQKQEWLRYLKMGIEYARAYRDLRLMSIGAGTTEVMLEILSKMVIDDKQHEKILMGARG